MIEKTIQLVPGFTWFGKNIGLKDNALDFGGVRSDTVCNAAGGFTRNTMPGAPVLVGKKHLADGMLQAIIVNSKYANVATMLCYFMSDARIGSKDLQTILTKAVNQSFNRISIDTDTSTSDTVVCLCNGHAGTVSLDELASTLTETAIFLAKEIARDGEGATKLIELVVSGAQTKDQALLTAKSVINSPLVKTAIYGCAPNWGRFIMAVGKVFQYSVDLSRMQILFGQGEGRLKIDAGTLDRNQVPLKEISTLLDEKEVFIEIVLGDGPYTERVWGCDLTEEYIKINAHYTT